MDNAGRPIVIIDDSADDAYMLKRLLRKAGIRRQVVVFETAPAARDAFERGECNPVAILCDYYLPGPRALDVLRWSRRDHRLGEVPFIILTGATDAGPERSEADALKRRRSSRNFRVPSSWRP